MCEMATIELLTVDQVAKRLAVTRRFVLTLIRTGRLPAVILGHKTKLVTGPALDDFIRQNERRAGAPKEAPKAAAKPKKAAKKKKP